MRTRFSFKVFTSFLLLLTFLVLILSGTVLFISPPGRVAHWTNWTMIGLTKEGWQAVHILMSVVFLVGGVFHLLKFNWGTFFNYLKARKTGFRFQREFITAVLLFLLVLLGTLLELPPFSSVAGLSGERSSLWADLGDSAPVPHLELQSLASVAQRLNITAEKASSVLEAAGVKVSSAEDSLKQIADANGLSPKELYVLLPREEAQETRGIVPLSGHGTTDSRTTLGAVWCGSGGGSQDARHTGRRRGALPLSGGA